MIVINYLDIENRSKLIEDLLKTELNICDRNKEKLILHFEKTRRRSLPQYLFLFKNEDCIGYFFLIGESNTNRYFPWLAVTNADSLPKEAAELLYASAVQICEDLNEFELANRLKGDNTYADII